MSGKTLEQLIDEWEKQGIIADIGDGVSIQDRSFKILYQSRSHKNIIGDHVGELCYRAYENSSNVCDGCPVAEAFNDGYVHTAERTVNTDKGTLVLEMTASPIKDMEGNITGAIEVVRNVSSRSHAYRSAPPEESYENRQNLANLFISIEQLERNIMKDDIHDGLGQIITSIAFRAYGLEKELDKRSDPMAAEAGKISKLIKDAKDEIIYLNLSKGPASYNNDTQDLAVALTSLSSLVESRLGIPCNARCERPFTISNITVITQLYRIAQESVTRAARYVKPGEIEIILSRVSDKVSLIIRLANCANPDEISTFRDVVRETARQRARLISASLVFRDGKDREILIKCALTDSPAGLV